MAPRIAVVEDDALMRLAISAAVRLARYELAFDAASGAEALTKAVSNPPDVAILDLHLGDGPTGVDVARALRRDNPKVGIVFLTSFEDPRLLDTSFTDLPAQSEYLVKSSIQDVQALASAIERALTRKTASHSVGGLLSNLTDNQIQILRLVAQGFSNAEIAKERFVTEKSVEVAISRIAKILKVSFDPATNQRVHIAKVFFRASGQAVE